LNWSSSRRWRIMSRCQRGSTLMCFCGDNCKLVKCKVLRYAYEMRFFMCANYAHDLIQPFDRNLRAKVKTYYISWLIIFHLCFIIWWHVFGKRLHLLFVISCSG
jgi:hypothetical protein